MSNLLLIPYNERDLLLRFVLKKQSIRNFYALQCSWLIREPRDGNFMQLLPVTVHRITMPLNLP